MNDLEASKRLAYVLRHRPETLDLQLDPQGWVSVDALLAALQRHGAAMSLEQLERLVNAPGKRRYAFRLDRAQVRALQGHSVDVELQHPMQAPPRCLYHGTAQRFVTAIEDEGLRPGARHHVHLSGDMETARVVGARHGGVVLFAVDAGSMHREGIPFFLAPNGVWLVDAVLPRFLSRVR